MRKELNEEALESIAGGIVYISEGKKVVVFSALKEQFSLKGSFEEACNIANDLHAQYPTMEDSEFDALVKKAFEDNQLI